MIQVSALGVVLVGSCKRARQSHSALKVGETGRATTVGLYYYNMIYPVAL